MSEIEIGTVMTDGTVFAGLSPDTGKMLFVMPADAPVMDYLATTDHMSTLNREKTHGHDDWRLPTLRELLVIFQNKEKGRLKGTFNEAGMGKPFQPVSGRVAPGQYRASDWGGMGGTRAVVFKNGSPTYIMMMEPCSVRYVREGDMSDFPAPPPAPYAPSEITSARQSRLKKLLQTPKREAQSP